MGKIVVGGKMKKNILMLLPIFAVLLMMNAGVSYGKSEDVASPSPKINRNENRGDKFATRSASPMVKSREGEREKNGAQFNLINGIVTLTTPSGNTHELKLPEQAIANMERNGFFDTPTATDEAEITQTVKEKKKILGIIPVDVEMELIIKTNSGEVTYVPKSGLMKLLKFLFTQ